MWRSYAADVSLKDQLDQAFQDMELIVREVGECGTVNRSSRSVGGEAGPDALVRLLIAKQQQLQELFYHVKPHAERQDVVTELEAELAKRNAHIAKLQAVLKDAESTLMTAIFQSNQKLKSIDQAASRKVWPETLIRFAHGISREHAVAAPLTWTQGDPERPFPTELELRRSLLFRRPEQANVSGANPLHAPMHPPPAPAYPPMPVPPRHNLMPHLAPTRQSSPGMFHPRMPQPSPYQGGPMSFQHRMPQSPLGGGGMGSPPVMVGGRGVAPPPYPGSPRGYSPRPQFPSAGLAASPRSLRPGPAPPPPPFPGTGYQGARVPASPRPPPPFAPPPAATGPYQAGPIPRAMKRPNPGLGAGAGPRAPTPPAAFSQSAKKPETDAVSSPDSSSSSSSDN